MAYLKGRDPVLKKGIYCGDVVNNPVFAGVCTGRACQGQAGLLPEAWEPADMHTRKRAFRILRIS